MAGWFVTTNDIRQWTEVEKRRAEEMLPLLVKKLILASCDPKHIDFPSGDAVAVGGWDGILEVEKGTQFVPEGVSGWEFGTNDDVKGKADGDYEKRAGNPKPLKLDDATFVFGTTRLWSKKKAWCAGKNSEEKWKDVQGINAESLETWLEQCPAVHRWFASIIGKRTSDLWDLEEAWGAFSCATEVNLNVDFLLNERINECEELQKHLQGKASITRIKAISQREAYGFALAYLVLCDKYQSKTIIVKEQNAWDWLVDFKQSLLLLPDGFIPSNIGYAVDKGHHVLLPIDTRNSATADISLGKMPRQARIQSIRAMGLSEEQAVDVYKDTRGFFGPLVRHNLLKPRDIHKPDWVDNTEPDILFGLLFITEWDSANASDKEALSMIIGKDNGVIEAEVSRLSQVPDPPVRPVGNKWQVISKFDLWLHVSPRISKQIIDRLEPVVINVLGEEDPSYDLDPEKRYMASIEGAVPKYSNLIKSGLADTLALLSTYGDEFGDQVGEILPSDRIAILVRKLFEKSVDGKVWYSLGGNLRLITEAAPGEVLDALERATQGDTPSISGLFSEGEGIFSGCPHSNLLWALEGLSWKTDYLPRVTTNLARLSEIDPGGTYSNRPFGSLVDIYLGWIRNTSASHDERIEILKHVLIKQFPKIAWRLMTSLLIGKTRMTSGVHKPEYRDWPEIADRTVTNKEYFKYISDLVDLLLSIIDEDLGTRICDLIDNFDSYNDEQKVTVLQKLNELNLDALLGEERENLLNKVRHIISHHREFSDAQWAWPEDIINSLEGFYNRALPEDPIAANNYLFSNHWPDLITPIRRGEVDHDERNNQLEALRISALETIHDQKGTKGIDELINSSLLPGVVGNVIAKSKYSNDYLNSVLDWIGSDDESLVYTARSYVTVRSCQEWPWIEKTIHECDWDAKKRTSFFLGLNTDERTFSLLSTQDQNVQKQYWESLNYYFLSRESLDQTRLVVSSLLEYNRPLAAVDAAGQVLHGSGGAKYLDSTLIAEILKQIATDPTDMERVSIQNIRYDILKAIEFVQDQAGLPEDEIAQIEWMFLKMYRFEGIKPRFLESKIARDPDFFVQLVSWVFKPEQDYEEKEEISEEIARQRAEIAYELIDTASVLPGLDGDNLDAIELNAWVDQARVGLKNVKRLGIGDDQLGKLMSRCPQGSDGIWPHEGIRDLMERLKSDKFEKALWVGRLNARGITSRNPFAGGDQERELVEKYTLDADQIKLKWPRTADILRRIARDYEYDARREDRDVELRE